MAAGVRIDPKASVPWAKGTKPAATAAALLPGGAQAARRYRCRKQTAWWRRRFPRRILSGDGGDLLKQRPEPRPAPGRPGLSAEPARAASARGLAMSYVAKGGCGPAVTGDSRQRGGGDRNWVDLTRPNLRCKLGGGAHSVALCGHRSSSSVASGLDGLRRRFTGTLAQSMSVN
jgi:hypothetical protein